MKTILTSTLLLLISTFASAQQPFTFNQGGTSAKNYYEEIPYEKLSGKMFITVEIAGKQHRFLFDTGAPVQITPSLAAELKSPGINRMNISDATGRKDSLNVVSLAEIKLGSTTFNNVPSLVTNSDAYTCWHIDGILGSNILRKSIVQIDPEKQIIVITDNTKKLSLSKKNAAQLVVDPIQSYPYILIGSKDQLYFMIGFDSGESSLFVPAEKDLATSEKANTFTTISAGYGTGTRSLFGLQKSDSTRRILFPAIKIGKHIFTNFTGETNKSNMTRMGTKLLDYGGLTLDFIHHQFYFDTKADTIHVEKNSWPIKPSVSGNHFVVGTVWQELKGQVEPGDQILAVDDQNTETIDICELLNRKTGILDGKLSTVLTIKNSKGEVKKIMMKREL
ncbi:aspartyl protease family protein [Mucilaginibacter sp. SMC90]|uniref:aspartyl protease family protein n=1 Tax=Mucilaginibacter sp. SMC90 TaxID=2929803 RepID=UPI001FB307DA|nr:aspartyl protease family protein [Mucilaginibacter sp. SMC90]UOE48622.1 aspartyl protease family protein [Mucilaginibacter sp. SMC90]